VVKNCTQLREIKVTNIHLSDKIWKFFSGKSWCLHHYFECGAVKVWTL
jgi:hypothetical protein